MERQTMKVSVRISITTVKIDLCLIGPSNPVSEFLSHIAVLKKKIIQTHSSNVPTHRRRCRSLSIQFLCRGNSHLSCFSQETGEIPACEILSSLHIDAGCWRKLKMFNFCRCCIPCVGFIASGGKLLGEGKRENLRSQDVIFSEIHPAETEVNLYLKLWHMSVHSVLSLYTKATFLMYGKGSFLFQVTVMSHLKKTHHSQKTQHFLGFTPRKCWKHGTIIMVNTWR